MPHTLLRRYQWITLGAGMFMMMLVSACAGIPTTTTTATSATTTTPGTTATTTSGTTSGTNAPTATPQTTTSVPGSIQFTGQITSVTTSTIVVQMPDGPLTMSITPQTDRSHYKNTSPATGQMVNVETSTTNGNFIATKLEPADTKDSQGRNIVQYQGQTTSAVGTDNMLHLAVGNKTRSFQITPTTDLSKFGNNAQSIQANQRLKIKVQFNGASGIVLKIDSDNGNS